MASDTANPEMATEDEIAFTEEIDDTTQLLDVSETPYMEGDLHVLVRTDNLDRDLMATAVEHGLTFETPIATEQRLDRGDSLMYRFVHEDRK